MVAILVACGNPGKREASALIDAVDRYRRAAGPSRDALGQAVSAVACTDARVCEAKQACVAGIEPTTRALSLKDEVARRLVDLEQKRLETNSPEVEALPGKLDEAERLLRDGRSRMTTCDARLTDLRVAFGG
jgi:alkanesulfonate monooxygenase SsuD/methylene tetrahydromethanopterin reductase-like flavin-dependent oxidoreductase (luciferase family)